jgi:hypothetical protein
MKCCTYCKIDKPLDSFIRNKRSADGLHYWCSDCCKVKKREWYLANKESENKKSTIWMKNNIKKVSAKITQKRNTDPIYKLKSNMRSRLKLALRRQRAGKTVSTSSGIGCDWDYLLKYIESKFQPGMTWENWGRYGWHMDHIRPIDSFDLSDPLQVEACFHYTNLQPLWAKENLSKSNKYEVLNG